MTEIEKQLGTGRTKEEIILHFLQLPLKNISSVQLLFEGSEENVEGKLPIEIVSETEPTVFSDYSNPLLQHVAIFRSLLEKVKKNNKDNKETENIQKQLNFEENPKQEGILLIFYNNYFLY